MSASYVKPPKEKKRSRGASGSVPTSVVPASLPLLPCSMKHEQFETSHAGKTTSQSSQTTSLPVLAKPVRSSNASLHKKCKKKKKKMAFSLPVVCHSTESKITPICSKAAVHKHKSVDNEVNLCELRKVLRSIDYDHYHDVRESKKYTSPVCGKFC